MVTLSIVAAIIAVVYYIYYLSHGNHKEAQVLTTEQQQSINLNPEVIIGDGDSDAPVQELQYFFIKDKGYHVSVWPKDYHSLDIVRFNIAGVEYREGIDNYLGEFIGTLEAEPTNRYDKNAIKVLAPDGHHVGYVPKDMTSEVRKNSVLPCQCFFYIGKNNGIYFSVCFIPRK